MDIKYNIPVYQMWNTQIYKYAYTQIQKAQKTQHVLYFLKAWYYVRKLAEIRLIC